MNPSLCNKTQFSLVALSNWRALSFCQQSCWCSLVSFRVTCFLFFFLLFWIWKLCGIVCQLLRINKDRPSFITIDIQLLTCWRQNLPPQLIHIHPFRRFSWFYWRHWKRCIYCLKGTVLYNNNFKGSPRGTGIFDVWYINIVNCEPLKQWVGLQGPKHLRCLFLIFSMR
jgi:hypothetical protein